MRYILLTLSSWTTADSWSINVCKLGWWPWSCCTVVWRSATRLPRVGCRVWGGGGGGGHGGGGRPREARAPTERDREALSDCPPPSPTVVAVTTSENGRRSLPAPCSRRAASTAATVTATPHRGIADTGRHDDGPPPTPPPQVTGEIGEPNDAGNTGMLNRLTPRVGELGACSWRQTTNSHAGQCHPRERRACKEQQRSG